MKKIKKLIKNYKISIPLILVIIIAGMWAFAGGTEATGESFVVANRQTVSQEVSVTGHVVSQHEVELAIESGGKVRSIPVKVGEKVKKGQTLLSVDTRDLEIRLSRQRAALEQEEIILAKAESKTTAEDDLKKSYENGFNIVSDTFLDLPAIISGLGDIFRQDYASPNTIRIHYGESSLDRREAAQDAYYAAKEIYEDAYDEYRNISRTSDPEDIKSSILSTYEAVKSVADAVKKTNNFVDYIEDRANENVPFKLFSDQDTLALFTGQSNEHLRELLEIKDTINDSEIGIVDEGHDLESIKIDVRQAQLDVQDTLNQIAKRNIYSPINGIVTDIYTEVGETISAGAPVVTVISSDGYQVEANLPEADMVKVKIGADADVILDAFNDDEILSATVVSVDPAETLIDGVATYKTVLQFNSVDERIRPGMTADVYIKGEHKDGVIAVPQRSVITKDGRKYVRILDGEEIVEKEVATGMRGTDGNIEILEGVSVGEKVIVFIEE